MLAMVRTLPTSRFLPLLFVGVLWISPGTAVGQRFLVHTYQELDGLPANQVLDAAQDSSGRLWLATRVGLVRYDGQTWQQVAVPPEDLFEVQTRIRVDGHGRLWTVSSSQDRLRLAVLDGENWTHHSTPSSDWRQNNVVGLEVWDAADQDRAALITGEGLLYLLEGPQWRVFDFGETTGAIRATCRIGTDIYLGCRQGLFTFDLLDPDRGLRACRGLPREPVHYLTPDDSGHQLWLVGENRIILWADDVIISRFAGLELDSPGNSAPTSALAGRVGGFFFGNPSEVYFFHPATGLEKLSRLNGLISNGVNALHRDREGLLWMASSRGLTKLISRRFQGYNRESGLLVNEVSAILELPDGTLVLGHEGGLSFLGEEIQTRAWGQEIDPLTRVMDLALDGGGRVWVATDRSGIMRLGARGDPLWLGGPVPAYSLHFAAGDTLWVASSEGLFRREGSAFRQVIVPQIGPRSRQFFRRITPDPAGGFFCATSRHGLFHYRAGRFRQFLPATENAGRDVFNILTEEDGQTWVGTSEGLFRVEADRLVPSRAPHPRIDRPVYSILRDGRGHLWFGTDLGVMLWNGQDLRHLTRQEGLLGNECNRDALLQTGDGRVWIGTDGGASAYRKAFDLPTMGRPLVSITGIRVNGVNRPADTELVLEKPPLTMLVLYRGVSFLDEKDLRYRTWLENFDQPPTNAEAALTERLSYVQVPAGRYHFHVQAVRSDGVLSELAISPWITIHPPLMERWYMRLLMLVLAGILFWGIFALISGRRHAHRLEEEVYQQTWDLRLSEQNIRAESRRLAATLQNISDGVLAVDPAGVVVLANPAAAELLGGEGELPGRRLDEILPLEAASRATSPWHLPHPGRKQGTLEVSATPVGEGADRFGQVVVFRVITDRLNQEKDQIRTQKLESLGVFAGGLAHDFNNLLTVMLGNISVLEETPECDGERAQMLALVREASQRARSLTNQLLTFARGGEPLLETTSIAGIVRQSVEFSLSGTRVRCEMDLDADLRPVEADPGQIHQVLANLVLNAVQAMPDGGVLRVVARNLGTSDRPLVMIELADEGHGIREENLARIFDPYFTTKETGSGLGLAIAYSIVSRHGGHITVESEPGQGSTFRVFLRARADG